MFFESSFVYADLWLIVIGLLTGLSASTLGGGGGFIIFPVLTLFLKIPAHIAISTTLTATIPICLTSGIYHYRKGNINFSIGAVFAGAGIIGAIAGSVFAGRLNPLQIKTGFGIYAIIMASVMFYHFKFSSKQLTLHSEKAMDPTHQHRLPKGTLYGLLSGFITGIFGTSGSAPVLSALFLYNMSFRKVIGTSVLILLANTVFALSSHIFTGAVDVTLILFLTAGSIGGAILGPVIFKGRKIDFLEKHMKMSFAWVMMGLGILMLLTR